jgi:hypothetical protein
MKVVDYDKSERGRQRRKADDGRLLHCCCICLKVAVWGPFWSWYGSIKEAEDGITTAKFCSAECAAKAGPRSCNVTAEMKRAARDAEWRPPTVVWREATDREKYREAMARQRPRP